MDNTGNVCTTTVHWDLCIGCGICAAICPTDTLEMGWDENGLLIPRDKGNCDPRCHHCLDVCPFLEHTSRFQKPAAEYFQDSRDRSLGVGSYVGCYVGYANGGFREAGASGGMASWFLAELLERKIVDRVIAVRATDTPTKLYEYAVHTTEMEIRQGSKSAYCPVELSEVLDRVMHEEGTYALIGLPCFVRAIRLAQERIPLLRRRIKILAGIVCGQTKSRYFSEYLASKAGVPPAELQGIVFRDKDGSFAADKYSIRIAGLHRPQAQLDCVGAFSSAWTSGMFSPRACSFCDDTFAEYADIVFMDAWIPEYIMDPKGSNLVVCRTHACDTLLRDATRLKSIDVRPIGVARIEESQAPVVEWKRRDLAWRRWIAERDRKPIPPVREAADRPSLWDEWRLRLRESLRRSSLREWALGRRGGEGALHKAERHLHWSLSFYRLYISSRNWPGRARRVPRWLVARVGRFFRICS